MRISKKISVLMLSFVLCPFLLTGCGSSAQNAESADSSAVSAYSYTLEDLKGTAVAVINGSTGAQYAQSLADEYEFEIIYADDTSEMYSYLESGSASACVGDYPLIQYDIACGTVSLEAVNVSNYSYATGLAVLSGSCTELTAAFNEGLKRIKEDGTYDEILVSVFGEALEASLSSDTLSSEDEDLCLQASGKSYIIATDSDSAPFVYEDEGGNLCGIDIQLLEAIAEEMDFSVEWIDTGFQAALAALEEGEADAVMAGMLITDDRSEIYDFTDSYYNRTIAVFVYTGQ